MSKFLNISTDNTLAGSSASNEVVSSQKAVKDFVENKGYITSSALSGYQTTANLVTSISSLSTDSQYPSAKCVYDLIGDVETLLSQV